MDWAKKNSSYFVAFEVLHMCLVGTIELLS